MKRLKTILATIEKAGFSIYDYTEGGKLCGYELSVYTDAGVNEILFMDFRDEDKDPTNVTDFIKEFKSLISHESIDDRIERNREDKAYRANFTLAESLKDFKRFDKTLQKVLKKISK